MGQKKNNSNDKKISESQNRQTRCPVVGIGASAGGLKALEGFFSKMPSDSGMAFVIIQHLPPDQKGLMGLILKKFTTMKISEATDGMTLEANCVYLKPPDKDVVINHHILCLVEPVKSKGSNLSIDRFFRSLAEDVGDKSIGIILSGSNTDGTLGLKAIKEAGGMAIVQKEDEAIHAIMPKSAINTGLVDHILPVGKMPEELIQYSKHPYNLKGALKAKPDKNKRDDSLMKIFAEIESKTEHDFSGYKPNTMHRRIERRMAILKINTIEDYIVYLQQTPHEVDLLYYDLLLGVTNFFRDKEAFDIIKKKVIPDLLSNRQLDTPVRIWVPGCGTGEEAYSLAMLFKEIMVRDKKNFTIQIIATDLNAKAIDYARRGIYPTTIAGDLSKKRLSRFFIKEGPLYKVKKEIRDMILFAVQCLIHDPPFSRLDMISCRNVMIYLKPELQKMIRNLFNFTLVHDGFLILGPSESLGERSGEIFTTVDKRWKIFKRRIRSIENNIDYLRLPFFHPHYAGAKKEVKHPLSIDIRTAYRLAEKIVLDNYSPPSVLINDKFEILYFIGQTEKYLSPSKGKASLNILKMVHRDLQNRLGTIFHKVLKEKKSILCENVQIELKNGLSALDILVKPLVDQRLQPGLMLVLFKEKLSSVETSKNNKKGAEDHKIQSYIKSLEEEVQYTRDNLQTTIEELETSNEELMSTNEELQSANEEIKSTNEELETSKEELLSANDELLSVNAELAIKIEELSQSNNDMSNLMTSAQVGTIFLDEKLCLKRYTPSATNIFHLRDSDIGRPIHDITSTINYDDFIKDAKDVLKTLANKELNLESIDGAWYYMRILPYRTDKNGIEGVVITFLDITALKQAEAGLIAEKNRAQKYLDVAGVMLVVIDHNQRVSLINQKGAEILGFDEKEIIGKNWFDNFLPERMRDEVKVVFNKLMTGKIEPVEYYENPVLTKYGKERIIAWHNTILKDSSGTIMCALSSGDDITDKKQAYNELNQIFSAAVPLCVIDKNFTMLKINDSFSSFFQMNRNDVIGQKCYDIWQGPLCKSDKCAMKQILGGKVAYEYDVDKELRDGKKISCIVTGHPYKSLDGDIIGIVENFTDITERKILEDAVKLSLKEKEVLLKEVHHRVKNNLQIIKSLLNLQCSSLKDKKMIDVFNLAQNRVNSMALVHEQLYKSDNLAQINFTEYIERLTDQLRLSYQGIVGDININIDKTQNIFFNLNTSIPCGLIINELVLNSFKYAFPQREKGTIGISVTRKDDRFVLIVHDNGIGLPKELDIQNISSLGLQLVTALTRQINGSIEIDRDMGTAFKITFFQQD